MIIYFHLRWRETCYYQEGERIVKIHWNHQLLPVKDEYISIVDFIEDIALETSDIFMLAEQERNVFEFVEFVNGWWVENKSWKKIDGQIAPYFVISDIGYLIDE